MFEKTKAATFHSVAALIFLPEYTISHQPHGREKEGEKGRKGQGETLSLAIAEGFSSKRVKQLRVLSSNGVKFS
jgi:hypothetical protein